MKRFHAHITHRYTATTMQLYARQWYADARRLMDEPGCSRHASQVQQLAADASTEARRLLNLYP